MSCTSAVSYFVPFLTCVLCEQFGVMRPSEEMVEVRAMCISQVLGTDMKKHFDITSRFQVSPSPLLPSPHLRLTLPTHLHMGGSISMALTV